MHGDGGHFWQGNGISLEAWRCIVWPELNACWVEDVGRDSPRKVG